MKLFYLKQNEKSLKIESSWYKSSSSEIGGGDAGSANINPSHSISVINQPPGREVPKPAKQLLLNRIQMGVDEPELRICNKISLGKTKKQLTNLGRKKWRYAVPYNVKKELLYSKLKDPANRSKLISDPTDFSHVGHIGQQDGNRFDSSKMIDLKEQQRQSAVAQAQAKSISLERGVINFGGMTKQHITVSDGHLLPHSSEGRRRDTYQQQGHAKSATLGQSNLHNNSGSNIITNVNPNVNETPVDEELYISNQIHNINYQSNLSHHNRAINTHYGQSQSFTNQQHQPQNSHSNSHSSNNPQHFSENIEVLDPRNFSNNQEVTNVYNHNNPYNDNSETISNAVIQQYFPDGLMDDYN